MGLDGFEWICMDVDGHGNMDMDICIYGYGYGYMDMWICGYMDRWTYGHVDMWICVYTSVEALSPMARYASRITSDDGRKDRKKRNGKNGERLI